MDECLGSRPGKDLFHILPGLAFDKFQRGFADNIITVPLSEEPDSDLVDICNNIPDKHKDGFGLVFNEVAEMEVLVDLPAGRIQSVMR